MARKLATKKVEGCYLLKEYASWIYCEKCKETIAYLCYITYDNFNFQFQCNCGNSGSIIMNFEETNDYKESKEQLQTTKNRLCCPQDNEPLITIQEKKLKHYDFDIACVKCKNSYHKEKQS